MCAMETVSYPTRSVHYSPSVYRFMTNVVVYALTHGSISDYSGYVPESGAHQESTPEACAYCCGGRWFRVVSFLDGFCQACYYPYPIHTKLSGMPGASNNGTCGTSARTVKSRTTPFHAWCILKNMKIRCINAYQVDLPLYEGSYNWSGGKSVSVFDSTIVSIETDEGITGYGEVCPLGPFYLPAYAAGTRTGIAELAPHLIGEDPTQLFSAQPTHGHRTQGTSVCKISN